ncbi:MAG: hypothetical protein WKF77_04635 [Planctomycetaceae bacterium]
MKIHATCPACQATIAVGAENAGRKARCPKCGGAILIPGAAASQSPPSPPGKSNPQASPSGTSQPQSGSPSNSPRSDPAESPPRKARRTSEVQGERPPEKGKAPPPRRRKEPAADDIWAQPLSSYSSPAIEEEHYEAFGIPPKRSQNRGEYNPRTGQREVGTYNSYTAPSYKIPLIMAAIGLGSALLFGGIGLAFPPAALAGMAIGGVIGFLLMAWGGFKILGNAFEDSPVTGFLYLLCGPYALYFLFSRWDVNQYPFFINLMGTLVFVVSMAVGGLAGAGAGAAN